MDLLLDFGLMYLSVCLHHSGSLISCQTINHSVFAVCRAKDLSAFYPSIYLLYVYLPLCSNEKSGKEFAMISLDVCRKLAERMWEIGYKVVGNY